MNQIDAITLFLLNNAYLHRSQLDKALQIQATQGGHLHDILLKLNFVSRELFAQAYRSVRENDQHHHGHTTANSPHRPSPNFSAPMASSSSMPHRESLYSMPSLDVLAPPQFIDSWALSDHPMSSHPSPNHPVADMAQLIDDVYQPPVQDARRSAQHAAFVAPNKSSADLLAYHPNVIHPPARPQRSQPHPQASNMQPPSSQPRPQASNMQPPSSQPHPQLARVIEEQRSDFSQTIQDPEQMIRDSQGTQRPYVFKGQRVESQHDEQASQKTIECIAPERSGSALDAIATAKTIQVENRINHVNQNVTEIPCHNCGHFQTSAERICCKCKGLHNPAREHKSQRILNKRFIINGIIAESTQYTVYHAIDRQTNDFCIIRYLHAFIPSEDSNFQQFQKEATLLSKLDIPNTSRIINAGVEPNLGAYLVEEIISGHNLRSYLQQLSALSLQDLLPIFKQLTHILEQLHQQGIAHRNLSIDSVICQFGSTEQIVHCKLSDWGITPLFPPEIAAELQPALGQKTLLAICPELYSPTPLDAQSDIYALGAMLFEILTQKPPFIGNYPMQLLQFHRYTRPPRLSLYCPHIQFPPQIQALISSSLLKDPSKRPNSMRLWFHELRKAISLAPELQIRSDTSHTHQALDQNLLLSANQLLRQCQLPIIQDTRLQRHHIFQKLSCSLRGFLHDELHNNCYE
jgi:serine/threonine protein kinase